MLVKSNRQRLFDKRKFYSSNNWTSLTNIMSNYSSSH